MRSLLQLWLNRQTRLPVVILTIRSAILIRFGIISSFSLFIGIGYFIVLFKEIGITDNVVRLLLLISPISLIVCSFIAAYIFSIRKILRDRSVLTKISFSFFGGLAGVALAFWYVADQHGIELRLLCDGGALFAGFIHAFARTACLNYGCCHGREMPAAPSKRLHITYRNPHAKAVRVSNLAHKRLYPVQLYESFGCLAAGCIVVVLAHTCHYLGLLTGAYFLLYGIVRFTCEFFRGEKDYPRFLNFTIYQWISIGLMVCGAGQIIYSVRQHIPAQIVFHAQTLHSLKDFLPFWLGMPLVMFFAYGFHYRKIGQWLDTGKS